MMNDTRKTQFKWFSVSQYSQEEEYLSKMHEEGWRLTRVSYPGFYHFTKCEPEKVTYRLDYNQDSVKDKPGYIQIFSDCGWEYVLDFAGYSYFCKKGEADAADNEIFSDDTSRLDMMKRVFAGKIWPLIIIFVCVIVPQFLMNVFGYGSADSRLCDIFSIVFLVIACLYLVIFIDTSVRFYHYEKMLSLDNESIKYKYIGIFAGLAAVIISVGTLFYFSHKSKYTVTDNANGFTVEAESLNKEIVEEYDLNRGDIIKVSHEYEAGEIYISVGLEGEEPFFYGNSYSALEAFTLNIQEKGHYLFKIKGKKAKGTLIFEIE